MYKFFIKFQFTKKDKCDMPKPKPPLNIDALLPLFGGGGGLSNIISLLGKGGCGGIMNLLGNKDIVNMFMNIVSKGNKTTEKKEIPTTDYQIKNYTRVE